MHQDRRTDAATTCFVPRGDTRLLAIALKNAARQRGLNVAAITAAVMLAAQVHRHQRRSADGAPYLTHPLQAATLVCGWGGSSSDVVTAVVHDAAEDAEGGPREMLGHITDFFGWTVGQCVSALTKNVTLADRSARSRDMMERLQQAMEQHGPGVAAVRIADRLHNVATSAHLEPGRIARLHDDTQAFITPLARRLGLARVADFFASGPKGWATADAGSFCGQMLALQGPWLAVPTARMQAPQEPVIA